MKFYMHQRIFGEKLIKLKADLQYIKRDSPQVAILQKNATKTCPVTLSSTVYFIKEIEWTQTMHRWIKKYF